VLKYLTCICITSTHRLYQIGVEEFSPPKLTSEQNDSLAKIDEKKGKSQAQVYFDQLDICLYNGYLYCTQERYDSFWALIGVSVEEW